MQATSSALAQKKGAEPTRSEQRVESYDPESCHHRWIQGGILGYRCKLAHIVEEAYPATVQNASSDTNVHKGIRVTADAPSRRYQKDARPEECHCSDYGDESVSTQKSSCRAILNFERSLVH